MMKRTKTRMGLCIALLCLLLAFIWGNSLLPGEYSAAFSQWVKDFLRELLGLEGNGSPSGHGLLRKAAHFTEFACLGMCLQWLHAMLGKKVQYGVLWGFLAACADETIQKFVPDRGPSFADVLIDTAGVAVGIGVLFLVYTIYNKDNNKLHIGGNEQ